MSDDVKAAVERMVADEYGGRTNAKWLDDVQTVVESVIAQHRIDSVPLTEAVLRASGFERYFGEWRIGALALAETERNAFKLPYLCGRLKTAGDLQRLCDALHLQITVVVPESEVAND